MLQRLIAILIFVSGFYVAGAQQITTFGTVLDTASNTVKYKLPGEQFYPIYTPNGSEFFKDEWTNGFVVLENGDRYNGLLLKYNTYRNELLWLHPRTKSMILLDKDMLYEFGLENEGKTMNFRKMPFEYIPRGDYYFNMLYDGRLKMVIWQRTTEDQTSPYTDKNGKLRNTQFILRSHYYLVFPENRFEKFKFRRPSFLNAFGDRKKEVRRFLRGKHARFKSERDMIETLKLIESEFY